MNVYELENRAPVSERAASAGTSTGGGNLSLVSIQPRNQRLNEESGLIADDPGRNFQVASPLVKPYSPR